MQATIKLGISAFLLGLKVRYDCGHKRDRCLTDTLGQYVEYVPVCPEVECGLGVPREALHLMGNPESPRLMTIHTNLDHTERMLRRARKKAIELRGGRAVRFHLQEQLTKQRNGKGQGLYA